MEVIVWGAVVVGAAGVVVGESDGLGRGSGVGAVIVGVGAVVGVAGLVVVGIWGVVVAAVGGGLGLVSGVAGGVAGASAAAAGGAGAVTMERPPLPVVPGGTGPGAAGVGMTPVW